MIVFEINPATQHNQDLKVHQWVMFHDPLDHDIIVALIRQLLLINNLLECRKHIRIILIKCCSFNTLVYMLAAYQNGGVLCCQQKYMATQSLHNNSLICNSISYGSCYSMLCVHMLLFFYI